MGFFKVNKKKTQLKPKLVKQFFAPSLLLLIASREIFAHDKDKMILFPVSDAQMKQPKADHYIGFISNAFWIIMHIRQALNMLQQNTQCHLSEAVYILIIYI